MELTSGKEMRSVNVDTGNGVPIALELAIKDVCTYMGYCSSSCERCPLGYAYEKKNDNKKHMVPRYLCIASTTASILGKVNLDVQETCRRMNWKVIDDDRSEHN